MKIDEPIIRGSSLICDETRRDGNRDVFFFQSVAKNFRVLLAT